MATIIRSGCTPASIATGWLLEALCADGTYDTVIVRGLPGHTIYVEERQLLIAVTTAPARLFRARLAEVAAERRLDVVLLRVHECDGEIMPVAVDLALGSLPCSVWLERDFKLYKDAHSTWLVPPGFAPSISVGWEGCNVEVVPPYTSLAERAAGIARAEGELARLLQPVEVQ